MLARGASGLFLGPWDLVKLSLPFLDGPVVLAEFPEHTGFERFLGRVSEDLALVGFPLDRERGVLRAIELSSFRTRYEIDIDATPSPPASINHEVWATVLRPLRQHSGREASLLLVETATGRVIGREPLGCTGWYEGHVQGGEGSVFVTVRTGPGNHSVRAYDRGVG